MIQHTQEGTVFSYLKNKLVVNELFREVAPKVADRPGGYTRIIKTGNRIGDNAEMCLIELVDFNELLLGDNKSAKKTTRRSRRGGAKPDAPKDKVESAVVEALEKDVAAEVEVPKVEEVQEESKSEHVAEETKKEVAPEVEAPKAEKTQEEQTSEDSNQADNEEEKKR
jgi:large subunit ribosomal protein L17